MKTISVLFKSLPVIVSANNINQHIYVIAGMILYLVAIRYVLAFFRISKNNSNDEE